MCKLRELARILIVLSCALATKSALAACDEVTPVGQRTTVNCTGSSPAFEPLVPGTNDVDLTVVADSDKVEELLGGPQAILLNATSTLTNNGSINATGTSDAIVIGDSATITNTSTGTITGGANAGANAIEIGNNATITNAGTITGGADTAAFAIEFTGTDASAVNTLENQVGGVIETTTGTAILGSDGREQITLRLNSTVNGDIDLLGGADGVDIEAGAILNGTVDLGAGDDSLTFEDGATHSGTVQAGAGNDTVILRGSSGVGSTLIGDLDLGDSEVPTGAGERNLLMLEQRSTLTGNVTGGAHDDRIEMGLDAAITGAVMLGDGANSFEIFDRATLTGGITGGSGADTITLRDGASVTGDLNLLGGADFVKFESGTSVTGMIDLGAGADRLNLKDGATHSGNVQAGAGNDTVILKGSIGGGSTLVGNLDLGDSEVPTGAGEKNMLSLQIGSTLTGDVMGGAHDDAIAIGSGARIDGNIVLGNGMNVISTFTSAILSGGDITGGDDIDTVLLDGDVVMTGNINLGKGDDSLQLFSTSTLEGAIDLGAGNDTLDLGSEVSVSGSIDLGDGNDTLLLRPEAVLPLSAVLNLKGATDPANEINTLRLGSDNTGLAPLGSIDLSEAETLGFDALEVDAPVFDPVNNPGAIMEWSISTSAPTSFDTIDLKAGSLIYDGRVELSAPMGFTQAGDSVMVFKLGQTLENSFLDLTGALTLAAPVPLSMTAPMAIPGAKAEVRIVGSLVAGDYTLISASGGITGSFDQENLPVLPFFDLSVSFPAGLNIYRLTVTQNAFLSDFAASPNQNRVASFLEAARTTAGATSFNDLIGSLDNLPGNQIATALEKLDAGSYDAHTSNILAWGRVQERELQQRSMRCERFQYAPLPNVVTDSPCGSGGLLPWAKVLGNRGRNHSSADSRYDSLAAGLLTGVDYKWNQHLWLSASLGYGKIEIDHDNGDNSSFQTLDLGAALGSVRGPLSLRGSITYSHGFHHMRRDLKFLGSRLKGQYGSDRVSLALGSGYRLKLGPILIEPNATIDYSHVEEARVKEKGSSDPALDLRARTTDVFSGAAGLRFSSHILKYRYSGNLLEWADGLWVPSVSAQWRQTVGDVNRSSTASLRGASAAAGRFKTRASDANGGVEVAAQLGFQPMKSGNTVEIGYDGFFGDHVANHTANVTLRIPF